MLSISSVLSLFLLLIVSSFIFFASKRIKIPYTVLLVIVGMALVGLSRMPVFGGFFDFFTNVHLTPELLFYIFLPILIFESAFNMNIRRMIDNIWSISLLSVIGLLVSSFLIATALYFLLPFFGLNVPYIVTLLFGAIISATDPVAVLALFKEYGAPRRLTMIFEGESLFNDGTAVALFLVILSIAEHGFHGTSTILEGFGMFLMMVSLGLIVGSIIGYLFSKALRFTKSNPFVSITLLIVSAHITFILCELINENPVFGLHIHISSIIATTASALFLGNYARHILSPRSEEYLNKSIEHLAFVANSLVFVLAGILFASTKIDLSSLLIPILITIVVVALSRIISVYAVTRPLNALKIEAEIPSTWEKLLAWGSLRGALAIIVILLIPDDFYIEGWQYQHTVKELLLALTIGCILATLFIKAVTIGTMIRKMGLDKPTPLREAYTLETGMYYLLTEEYRFKEQKDRSFVKDKHYSLITKSLSKQIKEARQKHDDMSMKYGQKLFEQVLRLVAVNIEEHYLKELYSNNEISETVYRRIYGKLRLQKEKIEYGKYEEIDPSKYTDKKDIFDNIMSVFIRNEDIKNNPQESYQYYRAQSIISRKVIKIFSKMNKQYGKSVFNKIAYKKVYELYDRFYKTNEQRMGDLESKHGEELESYISTMSKKSLHASGNKAIAFMSSKGIVDEPTIESIEHHFSI